MANTLTFANDTLTDANIFGGIDYKVDLNTGDEFSIGNTASACVSFTTDTQLPLYTKDQTNGTFVWDVDGTDKGRFYITEAKKVDSGYEIEAYDAMILLDTSIAALSISLPVTVSAAASAIAAYIGCTVSGTIINGNMAAQDGTIADTTTIRQLLSWVAEASGCSVKIDAADHICFMYYADSGITITASDYKEQGLKVADYNCAAIDNVTICDMAGMTAASAGSGTNSLFIQGNPFMYEATNTEAAAILAVVEDFEYAPLTCEMFDEEGLEVGVTATFGTATTLVMHLESSEDGVIVSSVGSDNRAEFNKSLDIIVNEALAVASDAQQTAQELNLHFWYTATGSEAGAHIAEVDKPTFEANPTGGNLLSNSTGIAVRDGLTELATFGANGAQIGKADANRIQITTEGVTEYNSDGLAVFDVKMNGATITIPAVATIAPRSWSEHSSKTSVITKDYNLALKYPISSGTSVRVQSFQTSIITDRTFDTSRQPTCTRCSVSTYNASQLKIGADATYVTLGQSFYELYSVVARETSGGTLTVGVSLKIKDENTLTFRISKQRSIADSSEIQISSPVNAGIGLNWTVTTYAPSFTFGTREDDPGAFSAILGESLYASVDNQAVLGKYNEEDSNGDFALIVGNGADDSDRSNAFAVSWDGNVLIALDDSASSGTDYDLYAAITALGWESEVIV